MQMAICQTSGNNLAGRFYFNFVLPKVFVLLFNDDPADDLLSVGGDEYGIDPRCCRPEVELLLRRVIHYDFIVHYKLGRLNVHP